MAFSETNFDSSSYAAYRPTYGQPLYDQLLAYHRGAHSVAVDIGCGTGQITSKLAQHFERVYGFDTSAKMLQSATPEHNVKYLEASAEQIPLESGSVDCITVGQAAHWFNHASWFLEMSRILRSGGTLSFWSYNEACFSDSEPATRILNRYFRGQEYLGPHWPQPGRGILESAMDNVEPPSECFQDVQRHYTAQRGSLDESPVAKEMPLKFVEAYTRTSSAFHNWQTANRRVVQRGKGGEGDVVDDMFDEIKASTEWNDDTMVRIHWPTVAVLARKK